MLLTPFNKVVHDLSEQRRIGRASYCFKLFKWEEDFPIYDLLFAKFRVYLRGHLSSDNKINHLSKIGGAVRRPALACCCSLIEISKQRLYSAKVQSTKLERTLINQQQNKEDGTKKFPFKICSVL